MRASHRPLRSDLEVFPAAKLDSVRACIRAETPAEGAVGQCAEPRQHARAARSGQRSRGPWVPLRERKEENVGGSVGDP